MVLLPRPAFLFSFAIAGILLLGFPGLARGQWHLRKKNNHALQYGVASFYSNRFNGHRTADGEIFSNLKFTAAHNSLPFDTYVKVTNRANGRWIILRINDRLHYRNKRLVDLTQVAARKLGFHRRGIARVKLQVVPRQLIPYLELAPEPGL